MDLIPFKTCNQDCIFCQLGRTTDMTLTRGEYVPIREVFDDLGQWLKADGKADHITLSGSGEPTLHSRFGEVLRFVRENSPIKTVLLTNGSLLHLSEVRRAAAEAHIVKVSLSAWDQISYGWVNRPHPEIEFNRLVEGQKAFRDQFGGELWMEVFLVAGMNSSPSDVRRIASLAEQIRPDRIHLNTAVRPPAEDFVAPVSRERLASLCNLFRPLAEVIAEFDLKGKIEVRATEEEIRAMLERRPCRADEIAETFGMHINEVTKYLGILMREGRVSARRVNDFHYYVATARRGDEGSTQA
ncbi:MAG: radical SAM protein [Deltaproteobacteria bacterium]|nr:radical SAM protein [Deltaproteobacteria bacterium]